ncbi:PREDICTED: uncharacterized protein LOC108759237 [Trachymyrmex cornetzi]|nr:PREDICTED: uncharacterized protein LOC108759237 [Trachymyrmex cornetzi]
MWVRKWIHRRPVLSASNNLFKELALEDPVAYHKVLRLTREKFEELLEKVHPLIQKKDTQMRPAIPSRTKLEITLRYLATGDSYQSLELLFRVPACTICTFLPEVLDAIRQVSWDYLKPPSTPEKWKRIMNRYETRWNFPNCAGAIDGKYIEIIRPANSGSKFFNYKGTYSIVLFAMVDDDYNFTFVDIGANDRTSDSAVFKDSKLNQGLENKSIGLPENAVIVGDDAFPLRTNLLKPYSRRLLTEKELIFNYRLSRARRISENIFGIFVWNLVIFTINKSDS